MDQVHLPTTTASEPVVSICLIPKPWLIRFVYQLRRSASQTLATASRKNCSWLGWLTRYNPQKSRGHHLSCITSVIGRLHLLAKTLGEPVVSACLIPDPRLVGFTYPLQYSPSQRLATVSSQKCGGQGSRTNYTLSEHENNNYHVAEP